RLGREIHGQGAPHQDENEWLLSGRTPLVPGRGSLDRTLLVPGDASRRPAAPVRTHGILTAPHEHPAHAGALECWSGQSSWKATWQRHLLDRDTASPGVTCSSGASCGGPSPGAPPRPCWSAV